MEVVLEDVMSDYETQADYIDQLEAWLAGQEAALEAVEWVPRLNDKYCPWCENREAHGHTDDCQRQQALGIRHLAPATVNNSPPY